jgi:hypothetical protein
MIVANATPVSRPAERRSMGNFSAHVEGISAELTVVALLPREHPFTNVVVEHEAHDKPQRVLHRVGGGYP